MTAHRPWGRTLDLDAAARVAGKSTRTIQRWVRAEFVRASPEGLSELDVVAMAGKRWKRKPRLRHTTPM